MNNKNIFIIILLCTLFGCSVYPRKENLFPGGDVIIRNKKLFVEDNGAPVLMNDENKHQINQTKPLDADIYPITPSLIETMSRSSYIDHKLKDYAKLATNKAGYHYRIGAGDVLSINVWHTELLDGNDFKLPPNIPVDNKGKIYYPYIGSLSVAGKTTDQVRRIITKKLEAYIIEPQVDVQLVNFESKKVYVTGEVKKPGVIKMTTVPITIMDALNLSGGLTDKAKWSSVTLNRKNVSYPIPLIKILQEGELQYNYLMRNGDILNVPRNDKDKVYLMGEVVKPQTVRIGRYGLSLTEALSAAGGINENKADPTGIFVIRRQKHKALLRMESMPSTFNIDPIRTKIYQLNAKDMTALALGEQFELIPGDVVYVTAAPISKWNRILSNILPSLSGANTLRTTVTP